MQLIDRFIIFPQSLLQLLTDHPCIVSPKRLVLSWALQRQQALT